MVPSSPIILAAPCAVTSRSRRHFRPCRSGNGSLRPGQQERRGERLNLSVFPSSPSLSPFDQLEPNCPEICPSYLTPLPSSQEGMQIYFFSYPPLWPVMRFTSAPSDAALLARKRVPHRKQVTCRRVHRLGRPVQHSHEETLHPSPARLGRDPI